MISKQKFLFFFLFFFFLMPISGKESIILNDSWMFCKTNQPDFYQMEFNDTSWENILLPHTWNALDGQDGGNDYYRGIGCYRKHIVIPLNYKGKVIYLKFGAANSFATVYLNGQLVGSHTGGYSAFMFDITDKILFDQENIIAVQVDNSSSIICPPLSADFTFYGGLTRNVELVVANPVHINPNEYISNDLTMGGIWVAQPGVIIKQTNVSENSADINILTKLRNTTLKTTSVLVEAVLKDSAGKVIKTFSDTKKILANDTSTSIITGKIDHPHLWNGIYDPYLYKVEIMLKVNGEIVDNSLQPLGFRYFNVDPNNGFSLNGKPYPLRGICLHEGKKDKGRAISDADRKEAIDLLRETGCNYLRLAHYQHGDYTYRYLDSLGIICWAEIPNVNSVGRSLEENKIYRKNAVSQMYELLRQQYNHPSIIFWGLSNEIYFKASVDPLETVRQLNKVVKSEDTYRFTTLAAMYPEKPANWIPDVYSNNRYDGWYYNKIEDLGDVLDSLHAKYPKQRIGISEYGAGANVNHHAYPALKPKTDGQFHPEEYQSLFHEEYLKMINARPYIWSSSLWVGFDFACDSRNEGEQPGINDKGLITFDGMVKKDAFYWYKANWNKNDPFVYITSRRFTNRPSTLVTIKIYSNCPSVSLKVNGVDYGIKTSTNHIFLWENLKMKEGENFIEASGWINKNEYSDEITWICTKTDSF
ncbi:glycoside hydrolase family 2 TIM barrel-domain containing protein [Porphyromonadaceae sp. NP-X]|nr:glycoside hydrolase family 2 TIM barrel-domain containing protein [Porphyromonadaceae sp. NP-X]